MANFFTLTLDTTGPANPSVSIENGAQYAVQNLVNLTIGTTDTNKTGYQMKIWGDVDKAFDTAVQDTEATSTWITFNTAKQVKLATGDGVKNIYVKLRDDVFNESAQVSDSIILDTDKPIVTITGPDVTKISKIPNKNIAAISFTVNSTFVEYKVKVVSASGAAHDTGTLIGTTNGSTNTSGTGSFNASTPINCTITGADLELASSGDGVKTIKIFAKDSAGNWSA